MSENLKNTANSNWQGEMEEIQQVSRELVYVGKKKIRLLSGALLPNQAGNRAPVNKKCNPVVSTDTLPEEIWEMILGQLTEKVDRFNCYLTGDQVFQEILKRQYIGFEQAFSNLLQWLSPQDVLNCRLVRSVWCRVVDAGLERRHSKDTESELAPFMSRLNIASSQEDETKEQDMAKHVALPEQRNPFVGKSIAIGTTCNQANADSLFPPAISKFLLSFGNYIVNLEVCGEFDEVTPLHVYDIWHGAVAQCPNLKHLRLEGFDLRNMDMKVIMNGLKDKPPFPPHSHLESVDLSKNYRTLLLEGLMMVAYSNQLKWAKLTYWCTIPDTVTTTCIDLNWENLEYLSFQSVDLAVFALMPSFSTLRTLKVYYGLMDTATLVDTVMKLPSLEHLAILGITLMGSDWIVPGNYSKQKSLSLKKLEVRIRKFPTTASFDFLLFFPELSNLRIIIDLDESPPPPAMEFQTEGELEMTQCVIKTGRGPRGMGMYKTKVWTKMERLNKLVIEWPYRLKGVLCLDLHCKRERVYTRNEFNALTAKKLKRVKRNQVVV